MEIIGNATDALEEVGGGTFSVSVLQEGDELVMEFSDSGPGIRDPQRIFDPFYTTKPVGKGMGLGLSVTYGVVQDHQGQISCENRPEGGAVFVLRFPLAKQSAPKIAEAAQGVAIFVRFEISDFAIQSLHRKLRNQSLRKGTQTQKPSIEFRSYSPVLHPAARHICGESGAFL